MASDITFRSSWYNDSIAEWEMIRILMGGTKAIRALGKTYLPQNINEPDKDYLSRLSKATLVPFFKKTINSNAGRIFAKSIILGKDIHPLIQEWAENIDRKGNNISVFFLNVGKTAIAYGSVWVLVDYPNTADVETVADEKAANVRPYLTAYSPESVYYAKTDAVGRFEEVRLREVITIQDPENEYGEIEIEQIRRFTRTPQGVIYQIFRADDANHRSPSNSDYKMVDEGKISLSEIPIVPLLLNDNTMGLYSPPPLLDLAYLCIKHWQSQSEQDNVTEVARFPILGAQGWDQNEDDDIAIGPRRMLVMSNPDSKFYFIEHSGAAIGSGRSELERLEDQIAIEGTRPITQQRMANVTTATQIAAEDKNIQSEIQLWRGQVVDFVENCLQFMAQWMNLGFDVAGSVTIEGNFETDRTDPQEIVAIINMCANGYISLTTLWAEMKRRGVLREDFNADDEMETIEDQEPMKSEVEPIIGRCLGLAKPPKPEEPANAGA